MTSRQALSGNTGRRGQTRPACRPLSLLVKYQATNPIESSCQFQPPEAGEISNVPGVESIEAVSIDVAYHTLDNFTQRNVPVHVFFRVIHRAADGPGLRGFR